MPDEEGEGDGDVDIAGLMDMDKKDDDEDGSDDDVNVDDLWSNNQYKYEPKHQTKFKLSKVNSQLNGEVWKGCIQI